jgi:hypothetical protein
MPQIRLHSGPRKTLKSKAERKPNPSATAFHGQDQDGIHHVVGIGDLRVVICRDGKFWFAQGLEIDYAAQGKNIQDVKKQFSDGLSATIEQHLQIYGNIERLLRIAPQEAWQGVLMSGGAVAKRYSSLELFHVERRQVPQSIQAVFPFEGINFLEARPAA